MLLTVLVPILFTARTAQACKTSVWVQEVVLRLYLGKKWEKGYICEAKKYEQEHIQINLPCFRYVFNIVFF